MHQRKALLKLPRSQNNHPKALQVQVHPHVYHIKTSVMKHDLRQAYTSSSIFLPTSIQSGR